MCLYPRLVKNPKYIPNKKNGGNVPEVKDPRTRLVPIGCGKCIECMKQKARGWNIRLQEEIKTNKSGKFVTLTFNNEAVKEISNNIKLTGYELDNEIATIGIRRYLERWRKKHKKSVKHWFITELGQHSTENIHLHGIMFTDEINDISDIWGYGYVYIGDYVNSKTINYITKYVTKTDIKHKEYTQKILCSKGIGSNYTNTHNSKLNKYNDEKTDETYKVRQGQKINMPTYYRNKIYTDEEKESLWINKLNQQIRYVNGLKIDISKGEKIYYDALKAAQIRNKRLGYGDNEVNWEKKEYEKQRRILKMNERIENVK